MPPAPPPRHSPHSRLSPQGEIVLTLADQTDLFQLPDLDPFQGHYATASGIERISRKLATLPRWQPPPLLRIRLPADRIGPQTRDEIITALSAFSAAELDQVAERHAALARERRQSLVVGLAFLALCLGLAKGIESLGTGPAWLSWFAVEGLVIAGWVALWHPMDLTLYAHWPLRHEARVLRALGAMPVTVEAQSSRLGPAAAKAAATSAGS